MNESTARTAAEVRSAVRDARARGSKIGLVPTMGALHEGHAGLIRRAAADNGFVVVSVFVNPTQFGPNEDFAKYPRQLEADRDICAAAGASLVFAPAVGEMYPSGFASFVDVAGLGEHLCGSRRLGHFRGVCTVVAKLLNIVGPDASYFGRKDAQQARIIEQMADDLNLPGKIVVMPTCREADGLAMSSRNKYLTEPQRRHAAILFRCLNAAEELHRGGERDPACFVRLIRDMVEATPEAKMDYVQLVDPRSLQPVDGIEGRTLLALALFMGATRLIDNVFLG